MTANHDALREAVALAIINAVRASHDLEPCLLADVTDPALYRRQADAILALPEIAALRERVGVLEPALRKIADGMPQTMNDGAVLRVPIAASASRDIARAALNEGAAS